MFRRKKVSDNDLAPVSPQIAEAQAKLIPARRATMIVYHAGDAWRWRLVAPNGKITADSGEAYIHRFDAKIAAMRLAQVSGTAKLDIRDRG